MKSLTKITLVFVFATVLVISGIGLIVGFNKANNETEPVVSSLNAGPIVAYNDAATWHNYKAASYGVGSGDGSTAGTAYKISSAAELALMAYNVNNGIDTAGKYYELTQNIDLSAHYWIPIGNYRATVTGVNLSNRSFGGYFDGKNCTISGVYIGNPELATPLNASLVYAGLFGRIDIATFNATTPTICNLNVNCFIQNSYTSASYVGGIAGYATNVNIENCTVSGTINCTSNSGISSSNSYIGGLFGYNTGSILFNYCVNFADISYNRTGGSIASRMGGLIAWATGCTIKNSCNFGKVNSNFALSTAGLVADGNNPLTINSCFNAGDIDILCSGQAYTDTGGLVGWARNGYTISNSFNSGNIYIGNTPSGSTGFAGLAGWGSGTINNCFSVGDFIIYNTSYSSYTGLLTGSGGSLSNCYYNTSATSKRNATKNQDGTFSGGTNVSTVGGSGSSTGYNEDFLTSQAFVDLLNSNRGSGAEWIYTGGFPTLDIDVRYMLAITFIFNNGTSGQTKIYQPVNGNCILPEQPVYEEHSFIGWFAVDGNKNSFQITADTTVEDLESSGYTVFYAVWEESAKSYLYTVKIFDCDNNSITEQSLIDKLISGTSFTLDQNDLVSAAIKVPADISNSGYRFDRFEINGTVYSSLAGFIADAFTQQHINGEEVVVEAYFMRQYNLYFRAEDSENLDGNAFVGISINNGSPIRGYFTNIKPLDKGTLVNITVVPAQGYAVESIDPGFSFEMDNDIYIKIKIGVSNIDLIFEAVDEAGGSLSELNPYLESGSVQFTATQSTNETILIPQNGDYTLLGYELWLDGEFISEYRFSVDTKGYVYNLDILELLLAGEDNDPPVFNAGEIKIIAVYRRIASLSFPHVVGSAEHMGIVEVYKGGNKVALVNGKSDDLRHGDEVTIKLKPNTGYNFVNSNGFISGEQTLTVDGQMSISIEFKPIEHDLSVNNAKSKINDNKVQINNDIIISLKVGFGYQFTGYDLELNYQKVDKKYVEVAGNSLVINLSSEFIEEYGIDALEKLNFDLSFNTKMSALFIAGIGGGGTLIITAAILIILYLFALKKKKIQLEKAKIEYEKGMARLSISDSIKNLKEGE